MNVSVGDRSRRSSKRCSNREICDEQEWKFQGYCGRNYYVVKYNRDVELFFPNSFGVFHGEFFSEFFFQNFFIWVHRREGFIALPPSPLLRDSIIQS